MHAAYSDTLPWDWAGRNPRFSATVGFVQGAGGCTDGVDFYATVLYNNQWYYLDGVWKSYNGQLASLTGDLSPFVGKSIQLFIAADSLGHTYCDWAVWTSARIVVDY